MREDQRIIARGLAERFVGVSVVPEWAALAGERNVYSPRVDIAVGPFAIEDRRYEGEYDELGRRHWDFLLELHAAFAENVRGFEDADGVYDLGTVCNRNRNARCFLAVEVEGSGSRKHTMGGAINAASLGRVGISVACSASELKKLLKMRRYLLFLAAVGKNTFDTTNLIVVTREQIGHALHIDLAGV